MKQNDSVASKIFSCFNYTFLILTAIICIFPMIHIFAVSFSANWAADAGMVKLWPVGFTLDPYKNIIEDYRFSNAFFVSIKRVLMGTVLNLTLITLTAYPLSKSERMFFGRKIFVWFFIVSMLFGGGLIPTYMVVQSTGIMNSIWALLLPGAVPVFSVILMTNFFRGIPPELEESAFIDGADHFTILFKIFIPLSKASLATMLLFSAVGHWNAWFDGILYMNSPEKYPLQSYLRTVVIQRDLSLLSIEDLGSVMANISEKNNRAAQIFIAMIPIIIVYPFLQKHFAKGVLIGSVKG